MQSSKRHFHQSVCNIKFLINSIRISSFSFTTTSAPNSFYAFDLQKLQNAQIDVLSANSSLNIKINLSINYFRSKLLEIQNEYFTFNNKLNHFKQNQIKFRKQFEKVKTNESLDSFQFFKQNYQQMNGSFCTKVSELINKMDYLANEIVQLQKQEFTEFALKFNGHQLIQREPQYQINNNQNEQINEGDRIREVRMDVEDLVVVVNVTVKKQTKII
ncbi:Hypothetical_protein [Hexamita inflata]|uniref:Hypothetical_protein n=1 Tax=Hexamita inflata TaxID=28002 RepID=A0AA86QFZ5_9EUKA|nr:Hypothetical protein HINF_LOCUS38650 [Hexamita inflata]